MPHENKPATTTTTQTKNPWSTTSDQLSGMVNTTGGLASQTNLWAPSVSGATQSGIDQLSALGQQGQTAGNAALTNTVGGSQQGFDTGLGQLQNIASGGYVNNNPYLSAALEPALNDVQNRVNSQFTAAGRYGSGAHASELAKQLGYVEANAYQNNYNTQMGQMQNAANTLYGGGYQGAGLANTLDQSSATPAMFSLQAGTMQDQLANQTKQAPINAVNWQNSIISPLSSQYGTTNTQSQTTQPVNKLTQGLGIAQMGLGLLGAPFTGGMSLGLVGSGAGQWLNPDTGRYQYSG